MAKTCDISSLKTSHPGPRSTTTTQTRVAVLGVRSELMYELCNGISSLTVYFIVSQVVISSLVVYVSRS